jgi:chemotaxis protein MotB
MSAKKGRKKHAEEEEVHVDERWMASYMDMVTVLMCMFIVLFAMSTVDQDKYEQLRNSLATGFGTEEVGAVDTAEGTVVPADQVDAKGESFTAAELAAKEVDDLEALKQAVSAGLEASGLQASVSFTLDTRGLTIRLVGSETYFASNRAELSDAAHQVLGTIAAPLAASGREVSVEGHADVRNSAPPYPSNWELSSARATQVLRDLVERGGIAQEHIQAVGFGSSRPLAPGTSPEELALNRRVDIVVLTTQSEEVSALIPGVVAGEGDGSTEAAAEEPATSEEHAAADTSSHGSTGTSKASTGH